VLPYQDREIPDQGETSGGLCRCIHPDTDPDSRRIRELSVNLRRRVLRATKSSHPQLPNFVSRFSTVEVTALRPPHLTSEASSQL
jgi:hypothetical protein